MSRGDPVTIRVEGLTLVTRQLRRLGLEIADLKDAFSTVAAQGARLAAYFAPKRSGTLAGDVRGNRAQSKAVVTAGRVSVPYAGVINYGYAARNIEPALFMQKASDAMEPVAFQELDKEITKQIRKRGLS